jgi:DNA-directed RNA polymerase specialized sigma24 family protein
MTKQSGRPRWLLDEEKRSAILEAVKAGVPNDDAAGAAGISPRALYKAKALGREALKKPPGQRTPLERLAVQFVQAIKQGGREAIATKLKLIHIHAKTNWTAAAWWLERRFPDRWGRKPTDLELTQAIEKASGRLMQRVASALSELPSDQRAKVMARLSYGEEQGGTAPTVEQVPVPSSAQTPPPAP